MSVEFKGRSGNQKVFLSIEKFDDNMRTGLRHGLYQLGKKLRSDTSKDILRKGRSGKVYRRRGRRHVASSPGEAPANWTGNLRRSLEFKVYGWEKMHFGYEAEYGKYLEEGTRKMAARPGLKINVNKNHKNAKKFLRQEIDRALRIG